MVKIRTVTIGDVIHNLGFKVVTKDMKSLGLKRNPNILTYPVGIWYDLPQCDIEEGPGDYGGIWVARTSSNARALQRYMRNKHSEETRIFEAALGEILFFNDYRIKTDRVKLLEELIG